MDTVDVSGLVASLAMLVVYWHGCCLFLPRPQLSRLSHRYQRLAASAFIFGLLATLLAAGLIALSGVGQLRVVARTAVGVMVAGSLGFTAATGLRVISSARVARLMESLQRIGTQRRPKILASAISVIRSAPSWICRQPWMWPPIISTGVFTTLALTRAINVDAAGRLWAETAAVSSFGYMLQQLVESLLEINRKVALLSLLPGVMIFELIGLAFAWDAGWPELDSDAFQTLAQIDAALCLAIGVTVVVPVAWRKTPRTRVAWIATSAVTTALALGASVAGMIGRGPPALLFAVSIAGIPAVVFPLLYGAYEKSKPRVGQGVDSSTRLAFERAYLRAGGEAAIGTPVDEVQAGREGAVQKLSGGQAGPGALISLWEGPVIALSGEPWAIFHKHRDAGVAIDLALAHATGVDPSVLEAVDDRPAIRAGRLAQALSDDVNTPAASAYGRSSGVGGVP